MKSLNMAMRIPEEIDAVNRLREDENDAEALAVFLEHHPEYVKDGLTVYKRGVGIVRPDSKPEAEVRTSKKHCDKS